MIRRGEFMSSSCMKFTYVALVLDLNNLPISPQYNVVFDYGLTYATSGQEKTPIIWKELITSPNNMLHVSMEKDDNP